MRDVIGSRFKVPLSPVLRLQCHRGPGGVGVGREDHVFGSVRAMRDMSAEHGALLWLLCQPRFQGAITQER